MVCGDRGEIIILIFYFIRFDFLYGCGMIAEQPLTELRKDLTNEETNFGYHVRFYSRRMRCNE